MILMLLIVGLLRHFSQLAITLLLDVVCRDLLKPQASAYCLLVTIKPHFCTSQLK